jgi:hypothetical protein
MFYLGFVLGCCAGGACVWFLKKRIWAVIDYLKLWYDERGK